MSKNKELHDYLRDHGIEVSGNKVKVSDAQKTAKLIQKFVSSKTASLWEEAKDNIRHVMKSHGLKCHLQPYTNSFQVVNNNRVYTAVHIEPKTDKETGSEIPSGKVTVEVYTTTDQPPKSLRNVTPEKAAKFIGTLSY